MKRLLRAIGGATFLLSALLTSAALAQTTPAGDIAQDRQDIKADKQDIKQDRQDLRKDLREDHDCLAKRRAGKNCRGSGLCLICCNGQRNNCCA